MKRILLSLIILFHTVCFFGQDSELDFDEDSNLGFYTEYINLSDTSDSVQGIDYKIKGIDGSIIYYVGNSIGFHIGSGYEYIDAIDTHYTPLYVGLNLQFRRINSLYTRISFGTHFGEFDKSGFLFRWGLGYQYNIFKKVQAYLGFLYCYQNVYKTVESLDKSYFNVEGVGFSIGLKFN